MSDYKITFSPELNISAADFADSWNALEKCQKVATASTETASQNDFNLDEVLIIALGFIGGVSADLLKDLVKDALKDAIAKLKKPPEDHTPAQPELNSIEIQHIEQPDGSKLLVVVIKK